MSPHTAIILSTTQEGAGSRAVPMAGVLPLDPERAQHYLRVLDAAAAVRVEAAPARVDLRIDDDAVVFLTLLDLVPEGELERTILAAQEGRTECAVQSTGVLSDKPNVRRFGPERSTLHVTDAGGLFWQGRRGRTRVETAVVERRTLEAIAAEMPLELGAQTADRLATVCNALEDAGVVRAEVSYHGYGDEGHVEESDFIGLGGASVELPDPLAGEVAELFHELAPEGYFDGRGGCGSVRLDVPARRITCRHGWNEEQVDWTPERSTTLPPRPAALALVA